MTDIGPGDSINGILPLDKPAGISSARAVDRIKRLLPRGTKIGHAGTLDPFATGLLLLLIGKATRQCEAMMDQPKTYLATIKLGAVTATDDPEAPEQPFATADGIPAATPAPPDDETIRRMLSAFTGDIRQVPPVYSAIKLGGRRACDRVRDAQAVTLQARTVRVYGIELLGFDWPLLRVKIDCGRGTYIRSIARDLGAALRVGGYLTDLRRTKIGDYDVNKAAGIDVPDAKSLRPFVRPIPGPPV